MLGKLWSRRGTVPPEEHGLPPATPRAERIGQIIATVACVWFAAAAFWEIAGPFGHGHLSFNAVRCAAADMMLQHDIIGPIWTYSDTVPDPRTYRCSHPWGIYWLTTIAMALFGRADFVCTLPPVVASSLIPIVLYRTGRAVWGPVPGAIATASYVVVPVAISYSHFNNYENFVILGFFVVMWGYVRLAQTARILYLALSVAGVFFLALVEWSALVFVALLLILMLPRGILLPARFFPPIDLRRFAQWWVLSACAATAGLLLMLALFHHADGLAFLVGQAKMRAGTANPPLAEILEKRAYWIELMFTPLAILIGKIAAPGWLVRAFVLRKDDALFALSILGMAVVHYVLFKRGADVHIFWSHYFAPYFALSMGLVAWSAERGVGFALGRFLPTHARVAPYVALGFAGLVPFSMLADSVRTLDYARATELRFAERGKSIVSGVDKFDFLRELGASLPAEATLTVHKSFGFTPAHPWAIRRRYEPNAVWVPGDKGFGARANVWLGDARFLSAADQKKVVAHGAVRAYGHFWAVSTGEPASPLRAWRTDRREPTRREWLFERAHDPFFTWNEDAWLGWELNDAFGFQSNTPPAGEPETPEQVRVAHNIAVSAGDDARAAALEGRLLDGADRSVACELNGGARLLGVRFRDSVAPELVSYFRSAGPTKTTSLKWDVRGTVESKMRLSWIKADPDASVTGVPFEFSSTLWKKGYIYVTASEIRKRPGREVFDGRLLDGDRGKAAREKATKVRLLTLD